MYKRKRKERKINYKKSFKFTNYEKVGEGLGANGAIIEDGNINEIEQKLRQLLNLGNSKPTIINAIIGKTNFREGSISV